MINQTFAGRLISDAGGSHPATIQIDLTSGDDAIVVHVDSDGARRSWPVTAVGISAVASPRFQLDLDGEVVIFQPDSPSAFMFEFAPQLRKAKTRAPSLAVEPGPVATTSKPPEGPMAEPPIGAPRISRPMPESMSAGGQPTPSPGPESIKAAVLEEPGIVIDLRADEPADDADLTRGQAEPAIDTDAPELDQPQPDRSQPEQPHAEPPQPEQPQPEQPDPIGSTATDGESGGSEFVQPEAEASDEPSDQSKVEPRDEPSDELEHDPVPSSPESLTEAIQQHSTSPEAAPTGEASASLTNPAPLDHAIELANTHPQPEVKPEAAPEAAPQEPEAELEAEPEERPKAELEERPEAELEAGPEEGLEAEPEEQPEVRPEQRQQQQPADDESDNPERTTEPHALGAAMQTTADPDTGPELGPEPESGHDAPDRPGALPKPDPAGPIYGRSVLDRGGDRFAAIHEALERAAALLDLASSARGADPSADADAEPPTDPGQAEALDGRVEMSPEESGTAGATPTSPNAGKPPDAPDADPVGALEHGHGAIPDGANPDSATPDWATLDPDAAALAAVFGELAADAPEDRAKGRQPRTREEILGAASELNDVIDALLGPSKPVSTPDAAPSTVAEPESDTAAAETTGESGHPRPERPGESRPTEPEPRRAAPAQTDAAQTDAARTNAAQTDVARTDETQTDSTQTDATQTDSSKTDSSQTDATQTDAGQTNPTETAPTPTAPARVDPAAERLAEVTDALRPPDWALDPMGAGAPLPDPVADTEPSLDAPRETHVPEGTPAQSTPAEDAPDSGEQSDDGVPPTAGRSGEAAGSSRATQVDTPSAEEGVRDNVVRLAGRGNRMSLSEAIARAAEPSDTPGPAPDAANEALDAGGHTPSPATEDPFEAPEPTLRDPWDTITPRLTQLQQRAVQSAPPAPAAHVDDSAVPSDATVEAHTVPADVGPPQAPHPAAPVDEAGTAVAERTESLSADGGPEPGEPDVDAPQPDRFESLAGADDAGPSFFGRLRTRFLRQPEEAADPLTCNHRWELTDPFTGVETWTCNRCGTTSIASSGRGAPGSTRHRRSQSELLKRASDRRRAYRTSERSDN